MQRRRTPQSVVLAISVFAVVRLLSRLDRPAASFADTPGYLSFDWWNTRRPWTVPLINTLAVNDTGRVWANVVISVVCWALLAREVAFRVPERWAGVAAATVLLFALSFRITEWDVLILSESGALSFGALWIAALLRWFDHRSTKRVIHLGLVTLVWTQTRESSVASIGVTVGLIAAVVLVELGKASGPDPARRKQGVWEAGRVLGLVGAACVVSLVIAHQANTRPYLTPIPTDAKYRSVTLENYRFMDVLGKRLMFDREAVEFMLKRGMPLFPVTENLTGYSAPDQDYRMYDDPEFVRWVDKHGQRAYLSYLLSEPRMTLTRPFTSGTNVFAPDIDYYFLRPRRVLPPAVEDLWWPKSTSLFLVPVALAFVMLPRRSAGSLLIVGATVALGSVFATMVNWHGAWMETPRHIFISNALMRVGLLIASIGALSSEPRKKGAIE
jgi:hypothetical protein